MNAQKIVNRLLEDQPLQQTFLTPDRRYFNFHAGGLTSTTWNWSDLLQHHPKGLDVFGWWVEPKTKTATNLADPASVIQLE